MANCITRHIPNTVTCCNLFSGCIASVMAFKGNYELAITFIIIGAVFDFFDGMLARLLKVSGPLGKELDSLADDITFGFAPAAIVFSLFKEVHYPDFLLPRIYALHCISHSCFLSLETGQVQYRPASKQFVHRDADPGQCIVLGFPGSGWPLLFDIRFFQCDILIYFSANHVFTVDCRNSDVLFKIQEFDMESEQSELYIPDSMHSFTAYFQNQRL